MNKLDTRALDKVETMCRKIRAHKFTTLSNTYVPGEGSISATLIIGEAPGAMEVTRRRPFVGKSGLILRELMALASLYAAPNGNNVENCWLTNVVKFRPPGNRKPTTEEIHAFRKTLCTEWQAINKPQIIIPVGSTALEAVIGKKLSILKMAGRCHQYCSREGINLFVWPMVHPSFGLRIPAMRPLLERDWKALAIWKRNYDQNK